MAWHVNLLQGSSWCYTLTKDIDQVTACFYYQCNLDLWFLTAVQQEIMEMMTTVPTKQWRKACSKLKSKVTRKRNIPTLYQTCSRYLQTTHLNSSITSEI